MHVAIIGASGKVGRQVLQNLYANNKAEDLRLTLISRRPERVEGAIRDIESALPLMSPIMALTGKSIPRPIKAVYSREYGSLKNADLVVMLASLWPTQEQRHEFEKVDDTGRLIQSYVNYGPVTALATQIALHAPNALTIIVTNQSDMMAMAAREVLSPNKVLGLGGMVDSSRLRLLLMKEGVSGKGHMVGYHNNDMIPLSASLPLVDQTVLDGIIPEVRAYGANVYSLQRNEKFPELDSGSSVLPGYGIYKTIAAYTGQIAPVEEAFNTVLNNEAIAAEYGVSARSTLSVPVRIAKGRVQPITGCQLTTEEKAHLAEAQSGMKDQYAKLVSGMEELERSKRQITRPAQPGPAAA